MNIPTLTSAKFAHAIALHLKWLSKFPALPNVRSYLLADKGDVLVSFDFASQELRTLAHYEDGVLLQVYKDDPTQDLHQYAADLITSKTGKPFSRKAAKTCIAKDQLVLTQMGLVPIQNITGLHLVWDGVKWVKHTGVLNKGVRQVIEYAGLCATYDHEVWTDEYGKIQFGDAAERSATLTRTGEGRASIRLLEDNQARSLAQSWQVRWSHTHILGRRVHALWAASVEVIRQLNGWLLDTVSQLQHDKIKTLGSTWCQVRCYLATLQCASLSKLQMVRRSRYQMSVQNTTGVCGAHRAGVSSSKLQGTAYRSARQQWALPTWQLETNNKFGERLQQVFKSIYRLLWTAGKPYASLALVEDRLPANGIGARAHSAKVGRRPTMARASSSAGAPKRWSEVYDITNAGPRNRFTVSGCLVSNCAFAILYGSGLGTLARQLESSVDEAGFIKKAYLSALPGVADLIKDLKLRAKNNEPIITWGGRVYYVEPPRMVDNRYRTFDYKLLNYLCQGSAADLTKAAIVAYHKRAVHGRIVLTVHDQIVITVPKKHWKTEAAILRSCMESLELDAKLLADGSMGPNLHDLKDFK